VDDDNDPAPENVPATHSTKKQKSMYPRNGSGMGCAPENHQKLKT